MFNTRRRRIKTSKYSFSLDTTLSHLGNVESQNFYKVVIWSADTFFKGA
jgi:hypothetical protein